MCKIDNVQKALVMCKIDNVQKLLRNIHNDVDMEEQLDALQIEYKNLNSRIGQLKRSK